MCPLRERLLAGWFCVVVVAAVAANSEVTIYREVGGEVALKPNAVSVTATTKNIEWREGDDRAIEWDEGDLIRYRQFKERGELNISTGVMTIKGLIRNDSGVYTPEIEGKVGIPIRLSVISAVPVPTIKKSCEEEKGTCELTCDGDTTEAGPVTYKWKLDNKDKADISEKQYTFQRSQDISSIKEFSCELENPVSQRSSVPISNPFFTEPERNLSISTGVTVFICLLLPVLLLALFHRYKTGMWFFEKSSMPWEADFWRRNERLQGDGIESNGTSPRQREQPDEETPMK
ncbi:uncharacterized protein [Leuresthes tenuis]|uniref:uncharacterized protein n=1 Tax=Leuresthes tenuis TaxID=355514 RepID=UPI003B51502D